MGFWPLNRSPALPGWSCGEGARLLWLQCRFLHSVNDPPSWKKQRLKDADKGCKDCPSILGSKQLIKSWEEELKKKYALMSKVYMSQTLEKEMYPKCR